MSSPDLSRRLCLGALALGAALATSGCLRPLYGPTASGERLDTVLAAIEVDAITTNVGQERFGHYLRSELVFDLDGSGTKPPKRYRLALAATRSLQTPIVDTTSGRADSAILTARVIYTLTSITGGQVVAEGVATGSASYDRNPQRFTTIRAARDADIRLARLVSEQIRTRLAARLATGV